MKAARRSLATRSPFFAPWQPGLNRFGHAGHAQRSTLGFGQLGGLQDIEGVRPHHHGAAAGGGFDEVLAAQGAKLPPSKATSLRP
jgi:hypothetical protein